MSDDVLRPRPPVDNTRDIVAIRGNNPYARAIDQLAPIIANALIQRQQMKEQAKNAALVRQSIEQGRVAEGITSPETMLDTYKAIAPRDREKQSMTIFETDFKKNPEKYNILEQSGINLKIIKDAESETRQKNLQRRDESLRQSVLKGINAEPGYKEAKETILSAKKINEALDLKNPMMDQAIKFFIAKNAQGAGVLSNQDISYLGGPKGIGDMLENLAVEKTKGKISDTTRGYFREMQTMLERRANENVNAIARGYSARMSSEGDFLFGSPEALYNRIMNEHVLNTNNPELEYKAGKYKAIKKESGGSGVVIKSVRPRQ